MAKTSAHFKPVKPGSEEHNRRLKKLDYVRDELTKNNMSWSAQSVADRLEQIKQLVKEKTGRSLQSKATPIREAVVVLKQDTTMEDLHRLRVAYKEEFGIDIIQMVIHKDEGHFNKKGEWIGNYHGHLTGDFIDHRTGKSLKLTRQQMSELQTVTAEVLGMERGVSSDRKHLSALQFKNKAEREKHEALTRENDRLRQEVASLNVSKASKQRLLALIGHSAADKLIDAQKAEIAALSDDLEQARAEVAAADQKAAKAAEKAVREALTKVAKAAGLYMGRDQSRIGIVELTRDLSAMRTTYDVLAKENGKLRERVEKLSQEPQSNDLARGL